MLIACKTAELFTFFEGSTKHGWTIVPLEATPHSLHNPTSVKHATRQSILTFLFQENDEYTGACRQKKTCGRQSLALPDVSHIQEIAHRDHASCSVTRERGCTGEKLHGREREAVQMHTFALFSRTLSVTHQDDERMEACVWCSVCTLSGPL